MLKQYNQPEIIEIKDKSYSLTFDDLDCSKKVFTKFDLSSDGYNWAKAIEKYCDSNNIDTSSIEFDPESDLFSAYSEDEKILQKISSIIDIFFDNAKTLSTVLKDINDDLWGTPEQMMEELEDDDVDFTKLITFDFMVDFKNKEKLNDACEIATLGGYKCFYSDGNEMVAIREMLPNKENIKESCNFFKKIAVDLDGKTSVYGVMDSYFNDSYEELEHWILYASQ